MNARLHSPPDNQFDPELEREAIGAALLGLPWPPWLTVEHFAAGKHRIAARAVLALGKRAALHTVHASLREYGSVIQFADSIDSQPHKWSSVELVALLEGAQFTRDMGWEVDYERLREMANQRRLLDAMSRVTIKLQHGAVDFEDAVKELKVAWE